jgi:hypothetical protein
MLGTILAPEREQVIEAVPAWRTWTLAGSKDASEVRLLPIAGDRREWPVGAAKQASCRRRRHDRVPGLDCTCGLYATHESDPLRKTRDPGVLGTVALWGRIVEHALGYRAEFAYPQRLRLVCFLCFWQWGAHGLRDCDVVERRRGGRMVPLCGPHLELCNRYGYGAHHLLPAGEVEQTLLATYLVDPLRLL